MIKILKRLFIVFLFLFLVGCNADSETTIQKLDRPSNLTYDGILTWNSVDYALSYDVYINDEVINVDDNTFVIEEEGTYDIYVIAKAQGFINSDPSEVLSIEIEYENIIDFDIQVVDGIVTWNNISDADYYNLFINGTKYELTNNSYELDTTDSGMLGISVQANYPIGVSNVSDIMYYEHNLEETEKTTLTYSTHSNKDIILWNDFYLNDVYVQDYNLDLLDTDSVFSISEENLNIKADYLSSHSIGIHRFYIIYGGFKTLIEINIEDITDPYLISSARITTDGSEEIQFQFDLFGAELASVNGNEDDIVLYEVNNDILVIEQSFIASKFATQDTIILSYKIQDQDDSIIGYLFINKEE